MKHQTLEKDIEDIERSHGNIGNNKQDCVDGVVRDSANQMIAVSINRPKNIQLVNIHLVQHLKIEMDTIPYISIAKSFERGIYKNSKCVFRSKKMCEHAVG
ncbi:hypothetical protein HNY73_003833 [Argiope bruennichi]|uniref:Uncharacterized protein n=1 Tax=Argiope bruennichi TaxID=94029 RepID=A0A8T0FMR7_ARGBR|nr:hypothetical protein HNY73_003833 [Argiope bruennichi]